MRKYCVSEEACVSIGQCLCCMDFGDDFDNRADFTVNKR